MPVRLGTGFRWLLASSWTTNLGDGLATAAGPLLVASLTGDAFLVSLAALLRWAPPLVFGLYAGVLSDRLDRRRIVMAADGIRAVVLSVLVVTLVTSRVSAAAALVALGLLATAEVFADNTSATLTPIRGHVPTASAPPRPPPNAWTTSWAAHAGCWPVRDPRRSGRLGSPAN